jgi:hypothetical protein
MRAIRRCGRRFYLVLLSAQNINLRVDGSGIPQSEEAIIGTVANKMDRIH